MNTYQVTIQGKTIRIKAKKASANRLASALSQAANIERHWRELTGVLGGAESSAVLSAVIGPGQGKVADREAYDRDVAELLAGLPDPVIDLPAAQAAAQAVFDRHLPVVDKRRSPEQETERIERTAALETARYNKEMDWVDANCRDREQVEIPAGMMAVTLRMFYDDSETMTDYFNPHRPHGEEMLLTIVKKGAERQSTAQKALERYPALQALDWTWNTETYSGGHGNWLQSAPQGSLDEVKTYGGYENPAWWYEITFNRWDRKLYAYKDYPGGAASPEPPTQPSGNGAGFQVTHERDWTWITFAGKPPEDTRQALKGIGARFSGKRVAWYLTRHVTHEEVFAAVGA